MQSVRDERVFQFQNRNTQALDFVGGLAAPYRLGNGKFDRCGLRLDQGCERRALLDFGLGSRRTPAIQRRLRSIKPR